MKYPLPFFPPKPTWLGKGTSLYNRLIEDDNWIVEPKFNGDRCIVTWQENQVYLWSRNGVEFKQELKELRSELLKLYERHFKIRAKEVWYEGELQQENGMQRLWLFDSNSGQASSTLEKRRFHLQAGFYATHKSKPLDCVKLTPWFEGQHFKSMAYDAAIANGDEGIVLKRRDSSYHMAKKPGEEIVDWFKVKETIKWH